MLIILLYAILILFTSCAAQSPERNIILVNVGNLDRAGIAEEIKILNSFEPKVVALDVAFLTITDHDQDARLKKALGETRNLLVPCFINDIGIARIFSYGEPSLYGSGAKFGFVNTLQEGDKLPTLKKFLVWEEESHEDQISGTRKLEYHFGVKAAMMFDSIKTMKFVNRNSKMVDINYRSGNRRFLRFNVDDVFLNRITRSDIAGKIVILGYLGPDSLDKFYTPLNKDATKGPDMYGIEYYAIIIAQILESRY